MATSTTRLSLRKPEDSDTVNVTTDIGNNMDKIDAEIGVERTTSFPVTPYTGKILMRSDQGDRTYIYDGSNWEEVIIVSTLMAPQFTSDHTEVNTTSSSYTSLNPSVNLTFVAPPSGAIYVTVQAAVECVTPFTASASFEVRKTNVSGDVVLAANDLRSFAVQDMYFVRGSTRALVTGLTPGDTYYTRVMCRVSGNTGTYFQRALLIEPVLKA